MKSLLGMASKRDGLIHSSVTSQPPRLTARTGGMRLRESEFPLEKESRQNHAMDKMSSLIAAEFKSHQFLDCSSLYYMGYDYIDMDMYLHLTFKCIN